jgi:hypothetical protein
VAWARTEAALGPMRAKPVLRVMYVEVEVAEMKETKVAEVAAVEVAAKVVVMAAVVVEIAA